MAPPPQRTILITGCSSGIGRAAALELRARGWRVFASCRKEKDCAALRTQGFESPRLDYEDEVSLDAGWADVMAATGGAPRRNQSAFKGAVFFLCAAWVLLNMLSTFWRNSGISRPERSGTAQAARSTRCSTTARRRGRDPKRRRRESVAKMCGALPNFFEGLPGDVGVAQARGPYERRSRTCRRRRSGPSSRVTSSATTPSRAATAPIFAPSSGRARNARVGAQVQGRRRDA